MATSSGTRLGFVSPSATWGAHYDEFLALVPDDVTVDINPLGLYRDSLGELAAAGDEHLAKTKALAAERGWQGIAIMGAPMQVQNPGLLERIRAAVGVPVTTALESGSAALRALSARRALVLTPFEQPMIELVARQLEAEGIDAIFPDSAFESLEQAVRLGADEVYTLAKNALTAASGAEAIYFQGARLNPLGSLERMEADFSVPVVASNPAMLWHLLSLLGVRRPAAKGGMLLRDWPAPVGV